MIGYLRGKVKEKSSQSLMLDVAGVGYELLASANTLSKVPSLDSEAELFVYLHVRQDIMQLYGFATQEEKELFLDLISISSVGPKVALAILSSYSVEALKKAVMRDDVDLITSIPGIGEKSAKRLILELKTKLALPELATTDYTKGGASAYQEAQKALTGLGYSTTEAAKALEGSSTEGLEEVSAEELVRYALKNLASFGKGAI